MITNPPPQAVDSQRIVRCETVDPFAGATWDSEVRRHPEHTVFHRSGWARVLTESYGHRPCYLRITTAGGGSALVPMMEVRSPVTGKRGVSLPFADFAGPLCTNPAESDTVYQALASHAENCRWHHLELRGGPPPHSGPAGYRTYHSHQLDLAGGIDKVRSILHENTRRSLARARASGLVATVGHGPRDMDDFYQLHTLTRRRHGLPPQPQSFFRAIARHLIGPGSGFIVTARHGGTVVAGAVFLKSDHNAVFKFGASDRSQWHTCPNHLVIWTAIRHLVDEGCLKLDFGRTDSSDSGLVRFKRSWGAAGSMVEYHRYHVAAREWLPPVLHDTAHASGLFRHLPLPLNRLAGRLIYPHLD